MAVPFFPSLPSRTLLAALVCVLAAACSSDSSGTSGGSDGGGTGGSNDDADAGSGGSNSGGAGTGGSNDASPGNGGSAGSGGSKDGGGGSDGSNDSGGPVSSTSIADYCQQTAERYFTWLQTCFGDGDYPDTRRTSLVQGYRDRCLQSEAAVAAGRLGYDGMQATRCLETIDADDCVGSLLEDDACEGVFEGLVPNGGDCYTEESRIFMVGVDPCADGYCDEEDCPGTCRPFAARDDSCDSAECGPDDFCHADDRVCVARVGEGEACGDSGRCASGLTCLDEPEATCAEPVVDPDEECNATKPCSGPTVCVDGLCRSRVDLGQACRIPVHCPEGAICTTLPGEDRASCVEPVGEDGACMFDKQCDHGLQCETAGASAGTCQVDPDERELNESCVDGHCQLDLWCRIDEENPDGVCAKPVGQGESCLSDGSLTPAACIRGLFCTNAGTCEPPGEAGDPCSSNVIQSCVPGLWCSRTTGLCTAPAEEGSACNPTWSDTCAEGLGCDCGLDDRDACRNAETEPVATDTCQPAVPAGDSCFRDAECERGFCVFDSEAPATTPGVCETNASDCLP